MKQVIVIGLVLVLAAGIAVANDEKVADGDYVMDAPSRIQITGELGASSPTWNRAFGSGTPAPDCTFQLTDSGADGQYYDQFCITTTDDMPIEIVVDPAGTTIGDTTLHLYCDTFDPADPLANCVYYDDDGGEGLLSAFVLDDNVILPAGTEFWLVLSTFSNGAMGSFTINTSDNVVLCGGVGAEDSSWSSVKGLFK